MASGKRELGPCVHPRRHLRVLAVAPHPDDIELGCGATIMRLIHEFGADCFYLVLSSRQATRDSTERREEAVRAAVRLGVPIDRSAREAFGIYECFGRWLKYEKAAKVLRSQESGKGHTEPLVDFNGVGLYDVSHITIENFNDTLFPRSWESIQNRLKEIRDAVRPDLVLLPTIDDAHQDHVTTTECANREFRGGESRWYYEILQFDEKIFIPGLFVDVGASTVWAREVDVRGESEAGEADRIWFEENSLGKLGDLVPPDRLGAVASQYTTNPVAVNDSGDVVHDEQKARYRVYFKQGTYGERKADLLVECFRSQRHRIYFDPALVLGNMAGRGMQCGLKVRYAEAYQARISV